MVIHSAVRRTLLTTVTRLFVLSMSAMDVLREARLQSAMRKEQSAAIYHAVHVGPGVFDDLAFLLDIDQRAQHIPRSPWLLSTPAFSLSSDCP